MKIKIITVGLVALVAGLGTANAQKTLYETGRVVNANAGLFDTGLLMYTAGGDNIHGTARSTAMGGAFTSLGADLSSVAINPAGLGMYQTSDWGISTALSFDQMSTRASGGSVWTGGQKVSVGVNNFGAAWNLFNGSGTLTSVTMGIAYNRAANFNSRTRVSTFDERSSIGQFFGDQLNYYGYTTDMLDRGANPFANPRIDFPQWGGVLGYQTGVVGLNDDGVYAPWEDAYSSNSRFTSSTRGGIHETSFSLGVNLSNIVYIGATVGTTYVNYVEQTTYEEDYTSVHIGGMGFDQNSRLEGNGGMVKLGVIVRPVEALRIGVTFHSPTFYTLEKRYDGYMTADGVGATTGDLVLDEEQFHTAPRLSAGISGTIGGRAIVALDGEMTWYDKMRHPAYVSESLAAFGSLYKPAATVRAGLEVLMSDAVSLRAGGSWMEDFVRDKGHVVSVPFVRGGFSLTCGAGFKFGNGGYLDVAYVYNRARMTDYDLYYFGDNADNWTAQYDTVGGIDVPRTYSPTLNRHMLTITLGQRF